MSFDSHLIHTCTIENPSTGSTNVYNNTVKAYEAPVMNVPCRLVEASETIGADEDSEGTVASKYRLLMGTDVHIVERARVSLVTLENGSKISDVFVVTELMMRRAKSARHQTAKLERIS